MKTLVFAIALLLAVVSGSAAEPAAADFESPVPIVMYSTNGALPEVKELAQKISKAFGLAGAMPSSHNPTCCVWLEVTRWTPNPGTPGYIIVHQDGGTVISGSTPEQLGIAVDRFIKSAQEHDGRKVVPVGLMTNYKIVK